MNEHNRKKEATNAANTDDSFDLVVDGFERMMTPSKETMKKIESDQDDNIDDVTLI
ncbi:hypothetical protein DFP93_13110 [Aneurinibacillus soli]|uniref:Uncharacterized protein n=1 Tax=Aneurinibacillus soli TaxID=1500254 RepID=A0A0U5B2F2_9BACL|nr:hypothetical protein [Aneurinibacillus soli]PYE57373.1 hypothetical protein DFP93_13110 [Aneurinibacillus soli]BAU28770.1 hypothetical protein CB4_02947 [Aneurinibacillus soli]